jgi:hypothetical protein
MGEEVSAGVSRMPYVKVIPIDLSPRYPGELYSELIENFRRAFNLAYKLPEQAEADKLKRSISIEYPYCSGLGSLEINIKDTSSKDRRWEILFEGMDLVRGNMPNHPKLAEIAYNTFLGSHLPISHDEIHPAVKNLGANAQKYFVELQDNYRKLRGLPPLLDSSKVKVSLSGQ